MEDGKSNVFGSQAVSEEELVGQDLKSSLENDGKLTYDEAAKRVLTNKTIVANILKAVATEFKDIPIEQIRELLGKMGRGVTDAKIKCNPVEDVRTGMLTIKFDVNAYLVDPDLHINFEFNIEPQNKTRPGYSIYKRGVYYCSRMIARQLGPGDKDQYDKLHKCYSIWVCFHSDRVGKRNDILSYSFARDTDALISENIPEVFKADKDTDLAKLVYIFVPKVAEDIQTGVQKLLFGIFRNEPKMMQPYLTKTEYKAIIEEVITMGELETAMREESFEEGREEGRKEGRKEGREEGKIEGAVRMGITTVERLLKRSKSASSEEALEEALECAGITKKMWNRYKTLGSIDALLADIKSNG